MRMRAPHISSNQSLFNYPSYSPGLAPEDFFLFPHIKRKMRDQRFYRQKMLLKRSVTMFWRCLNRSRKSVSTIGLSACILLENTLKNNKTVFND